MVNITELKVKEQLKAFINSKNSDLELNAIPTLSNDLFWTKLTSACNGISLSTSSNDNHYDAHWDDFKKEENASHQAYQLMASIILKAPLYNDIDPRWLQDKNNTKVVMNVVEKTFEFELKKTQIDSSQPLSHHQNTLPQTLNDVDIAYESNKIESAKIDFDFNKYLLVGIGAVYKDSEEAEQAINSKKISQDLHSQLSEETQQLESLTLIKTTINQLGSEKKALNTQHQALTEQLTTAIETHKKLLSANESLSSIESQDSAVNHSMINIELSLSNKREALQTTHSEINQCDNKIQNLTTYKKQNENKQEGSLFRKTHYKDKIAVIEKNLNKLHAHKNKLELSVTKLNENIISDHTQLNKLNDALINNTLNKGKQLGIVQSITPSHKGDDIKKLPQTQHKLIESIKNSLIENEEKTKGIEQKILQLTNEDSKIRGQALGEAHLKSPQALIRDKKSKTHSELSKQMAINNKRIAYVALTLTLTVAVALTVSAPILGVCVLPPAISILKKGYDLYKGGLTKNTDKKLVDTLKNNDRIEQLYENALNGTSRVPFDLNKALSINDKNVSVINYLENLNNQAPERAEKIIDILQTMHELQDDMNPSQDNSVLQSGIEQLNVELQEQLKAADSISNKKSFIERFPKLSFLSSNVQIEKPNQGVQLFNKLMKDTNILNHSAIQQLQNTEKAMTPSIKASLNQRLNNVKNQLKELDPTNFKKFQLPDDKALNEIMKAEPKEAQRLLTIYEEVIRVHQELHVTPPQDSFYVIHLQKNVERSYKNIKEKYLQIKESINPSHSSEASLNRQESEEDNKAKELMGGDTKLDAIIAHKSELLHQRQTEQGEKKSLGEILGNTMDNDIEISPSMSLG